MIWQLFYCKTEKFLLQSTKIVYYKVGWLYYKMRKLLRIVLVKNTTAYVTKHHMLLHNMLYCYVLYYHISIGMVVAESWHMILFSISCFIYLILFLFHVLIFSFFYFLFYFSFCFVSFFTFIISIFYFYCKLFFFFS